MKEIVAVDLDDVVVDSARPIIDHYNANYGTLLQLADFYSTDYINLWDAPDKATAVGRVNKFLASDDYFEAAPEDQTINVIQGLKRAYRLFVVTGRPDFMKQATDRWMETYLPNVFEGMIFTNYFNERSVRSKGDICKELGVVTLIDDHLDHVLSAAQSGVEGVLFGDYPWNQTADKLPTGITRVANWQAVAEHLGV